MLNLKGKLLPFSSFFQSCFFLQKGWRKLSSSLVFLALLRRGWSQLSSSFSFHCLRRKKHFCFHFIFSLVYYEKNNDNCYHNPSLGLVTKARTYKGVPQERSPGVTSHASGVYENVREGTFTFLSELSLWELESQWSPNGVPNFQRAIVGVNTHWIE